MAIVLPLTGSLNWDVSLNAVLTQLDSEVTQLQNTSLTTGTAVNGDLSGTLPGPSVTSTHLAAPLPVAQGGTGSATQNYVDLTSAQTIAGIKTFSNNTILNGTVTVTGAANFNGQVIENSTTDRMAFSAVYTTTANTTNAAFNSVHTATTGRTLATGVTGDSVQRFTMGADGGMSWGPGGATARDASFGRTATAQMGVSTADLAIVTTGKGLKIAEGTGAKMGITAAMTAGTITVANTSVNANSRIFLTAQNTGGTPGALRVSTITAGTSFVITSTSATDTSTVAWFIVDHT